MAFNPSDGYDEDNVTLGAEGDCVGYEVKAFCSPDSDGQLYFSDGSTVSNEDVNPFHNNLNGAPFTFDVVLVNDVYPQEGDVDKIAEELGEKFNKQFSNKVDSIFNEIKDADDPIETILEMEPDELIIEEE